ncbi:MAG: glycoside hydrolase family 9 [Chthonomonadaceae bacterium]|nr:glycoside hydrolase family 9 [Chthonomonadaceae bacterium]
MSGHVWENDKSGASDLAQPILPELAARRRRSRTVPPVRQVIDARVHINQVGFLPGEPKRAVISATGAIVGNSFTVVDDDVTPQPRYTGKLQAYAGPNGAKYGHYDRHFFADFGELQRPGRYRLRLSDGHLSPPFSIGSDVYSRLVPLVLKYFDVQCCGTQKSAHRGDCHVDDGVIVGGPRDGERIDASGGWHDAGDYMKFVETTSYVTAVMLFAYDHYRRQFPAHGPSGAMPQLLAYARVGLDWLLKMHPSPQEFYYQVGDATDHDTWRLPEEDCAAHRNTWEPRPVYSGVGANLAGRTAVALAIASRLYRPYARQYADRCLASAQTAYRLGLDNRKALTTNPSDFYPEQTWADDMEWAAATLYRATGRQEYLQQALEFSIEAGPANDQTSVYNTHALAHYTLFPYASPAHRQLLLDHLRSDAELTRHRAENPYCLGTPYIWGTAEAAAGAAITSLIYAKLSGEKEYVDLARCQRDFILGCNPFGLSCVIGAGTRYPLFPHHQVANIRNIELSGALVGGPASVGIFQQQKISLEGVEFSTQTEGPVLAQDLPDEIGVYHDAVQDFVTNEPANDYTAKFLLLTAFYIAPEDALHKRVT